MIQLQLFSALYAFLLAWHERTGVLYQREFGKVRNLFTGFHASSWLLKAFWVGYNYYLLSDGSTIRNIILIGLPVVIMWLVFNLTLNGFTNMRWYYLGTTARVDRIFSNLGVELNIGLATIIIVVNIFMKKWINY